MAAAERDLRRKAGRSAHERWLGFREAGHAGLLDDIGFGWAMSSIGALGVIVASLPVASYEWRKNPE
jgi:hypothetical protein